jgi:cytochrome c biogenesis protein CcdA
MPKDSTPLQPNGLGKASLILGIVAIIFVFFIGLCAGVGKQQGWLASVGTLLFIVGATFAFMGLVGGLLGLGGLLGRNRSRATAIAGLLLGLASVLLFLAILNGAQ